MADGIERDLRFKYAMLKDKGQLRTLSRYASATSVAAGSDKELTGNPFPHTTTGEKYCLSLNNPSGGAQKFQRRKVIIVVAEV